MLHVRYIYLPINKSAIIVTLFVLAHFLTKFVAIRAVIKIGFSSSFGIIALAIHIVFPGSDYSHFNHPRGTDYDTVLLASSPGSPPTHGNCKEEGSLVDFIT